ncbi:WhiB family transcriptional regulator [Saccharopolyspora soli]|uniref:WhiB family transcriptional regulator n=1 Tax=Saccharopolyspora soli TaxID=2926618 RepID=UPI0027DF2228|nr:WhiB family transcriptional regulator [Saccharopolyspora soli]
MRIETSENLRSPSQSEQRANNQRRERQVPHAGGVAHDHSARPEPFQFPRWRSGAACRGRVDLDFVEPTSAEAQQCRAVCAACPVREHCLAEALATAEPWGIWGGLDTDEREALAKRTGHPEPAILPAHGTNTRYARHGCRCALCRSAHTNYERQRRARRRRRAIESHGCLTVVPVPLNAAETTVITDERIDHPFR